ncbi:LysR family transcriptional regulator [Zoogloea sp.]|uniref:LysR family transcriptional regulator n=1 Tax=Zoogloea sp. TaxID=49181 RepID=UPI0026257168|nr:LysR family transcriptional regulator [uncultured Zoogloea sp.]
MDRFQAMRLFTRIVELGSFSRAAENLGLPRASATQIIKQLEAQLGVRLLQRTTRQVRTTLDGDAYYQRCVAILADIDEMESSFSLAAGQPRGRIKVDLSVSFCRLVMIPALPDFCARYPQIQVEVSVTDRQIDLIREGVDCVMRIGELRDSSLAARRLTTLPQVCCASSAYLARHGTPQRPDELAGHRAVDYQSASTGKSIPFEFTVDGRVEAHSLPYTVAVNNGDAYVAACEAGFGIIQVPAYHVTRQLAAGTLVEVLGGFRAPPLPLTVLYPQSRQLSPRVRVFIDWLAELFADPKL